MKRKFFSLSGSSGWALAVLLGLCSVNCAKKSSSSGANGSCSTTHFSATSYPTIASTSGVTPNNVMTVTVDGSLCGSGAYTNEPCVQVTLCSPADPSKCQTISNLLLDTGSFGLRIFSSAVTIPLTPITSSSGTETLAECVVYGDNSSQWGSVNYAYLQLANESMVGVPVHLINEQFGTPPDSCSSAITTPDLSPSQAHFNGILGVGMLTQDCGSTCETDSSVGMYYSCNGSGCGCGATVDLGAQVQNPVALLPNDNNGVVLSFPTPSPVPSGGSASVTGSLYFGINTQSNNTVGSSVTPFFADSNLTILTDFPAYSSSSLPAFLDSGSNSNDFPLPSNNSLYDCGSAYSGYWCIHSSRSQPLTFAATISDSYGNSSGSFNFQVGDFATLAASQHSVFPTASGSVGSSPYFDWGLPFFLNRVVYVGINGKTTSNLGIGPFWAF